MNWIRNWSYKPNGPAVSRLDFFLMSGCRFFVGAWAFLMLTVFPLYMKNGYNKMGVHKFRLFMGVSVVCLLPAFMLFSVSLLKSLREKRLKEIFGRLSALDIAMLLYLCATLVSYFFSSYRGTALTGVTGWYNGLRTQLLLVVIYFLVSRAFPFKGILFAGHFISSSAVFVFGILHRFGIDPLRVYEGVDESYHIWYLSTIGQSTWYSSYVCIVLVIGAAVFFLTEKPLIRLLTGAHCMLGFATVVTQNSDSAFVAMIMLFFVLFIVACDSAALMERFFETLLLMFGSFIIVGIFQQLFPENAVELGSLSEFLSQSAFTWVLLMMAALFYIAFLLWRQKQAEGAKESAGILPYGGLVRKIAAAAFLSAIVLYVLLVWLNTTGVLDEWFGVSSRNQYLYFDRYWGNSRGFIWKFTAGVFAGLPLYRKLFGVGPDCFMPWCYGNPELSAQLDRYFGLNETLTNAHNEFLNTMFCMGIVGLLAFLLIFGTAFFRFYRLRLCIPPVLLGMLAVLVYAGHNFFCYQQVCCTPFLFLILGMSENLARAGGNNWQKITRCKDT